MAETSDGRCVLQFHRPAGAVLFELELDSADRSYRINGAILEGYSRAQMRDLRIAVRVDAQDLVLTDSGDALGEYLQKTGTGTPIGPFFAVLDDSKAERLELTTGSKVHALTMTGYDQAREELRECISAFLTVADPGRGPRLIAFDGLSDLKAAAWRQRLLSQDLHATLTVDPEGKPTDCALSRRFRRKATRLALCRPLLETMVFDPARDASGQPVEGTYKTAIGFEMMMGSDGYLKD